MCFMSIFLISGCFQWKIRNSQWERADLLKAPNFIMIVEHNPSQLTVFLLRSHFIMRVSERRVSVESPLYSRCYKRKTCGLVFWRNLQRVMPVKISLKCPSICGLPGFKKRWSSSVSPVQVSIVNQRRRVLADVFRLRGWCFWCWCCETILH